MSRRLCRISERGVRTSPVPWSRGESVGTSSRLSTSQEGWQEYLRWNRALADVIYCPAVTGAPAYLDPEPDVLQTAAAAAQVVTTNPREALIKALRPTLNRPDHPAGMFEGHVVRLMQWRRDSGDPPPVIGLLTVLCLAAEDMRESDGFAANNYYDRLMPLLGVSSEVDKRRVIATYRKRSFDLWESLNTWLESLHGERGLPTAYAYTHEHVGRPLSQALVRTADRKKLEEFFSDVGFEQRSRVSSDDLEPLLNAWINRSPSPASHQIRALWKRSGARERILEVACQLLESWEPPAGNGRHGAGGGRLDHRLSALRLLALLRTFPSPAVELSLLGPDVDSADLARLVDANDGRDLGVDVALEPLPGGRWRLLDADEFESPALTDGAIRLAFASGAALERRPRRVVPLKKDDLLQAFVEVERLALGEDGMVLCTSGLASIVDDALGQIARPGYHKLDPPPCGCPPGWVLFTQIQVLTQLATASPSTEKHWPLDLNVLQPLSSSQLTIQGGLQLPGRIRRWSSRAAPELRAAAEDVDAIRVTVERVGTFQETVRVLDIQVHEPTLLLDLRNVDLADGDYDVIAIGLLGSGSRTLNSGRLRLRSADNRNPVPLSGRSLFCPATNSGPVAVYPSTWDGASAGVRGAGIVEPIQPDNLSQSVVGVPMWWLHRRDPSRRARPDVTTRPRLTVSRATNTDCFQTGAHVLQLPTYYGKPTTRTIEGVCKHCGLVKRFPGSYYSLRKRVTTRHATARTAPTFDVLNAPPVLDDPGVTPDVALDALSHDAAGPASWIEQLALQVEPSQLFVDRFVRALDVLAHLEVERCSRTLAIASWEVLPVTLVGLPGDGFVLAGQRSRQLERTLTEVAGDLGLRVERTSQQPVAPDRILFHTDLPGAKTLAGYAGNKVGVDIVVVAEAARRMAAVLPNLRMVIDSLPRQAMLGARSIRQWSTDVARWQAVGDASVPGAYQLLSPAPAYCLRDERDIAEGTMRRVDARLAKHAAAFNGGRTLIGYDYDTATLYVPLGADLPGLYGRAATLCSGQLAFEDEAQHVTRYSSVPRDIAEHLAALLQPEAQ